MTEPRNNYQTIIRLLPTLSAEEVGKLKQALMVTSQTKTFTHAAVEDNSLITIVCEFAAEQGFEMRSAQMIKRTPGYSTYLEKERDLVTWLRSHVANKLEREVIFKTGLHLLSENLRSMRVPISILMIMAHIHRIPAVLDQAFPGYASCGMLGQLISKRK